MSKSYPGKEHHVGFDNLIDHPDARYIAESRELFHLMIIAITDLLARAESEEARAEKAERERDAAIKMLRKIEWCNGCKNFRGLQGCRIGALVTCNPQNDMYVFGEGEE